MITQSSSQASTSSTEPERSSTPPGLVELDASPYTVQSSFKVYDRHDLESIISPQTNPLICQILYNAMALGRAFLTVDHVRRRICWAFRQSFRTASQDWSDPPAVQPPEQVTRDTLLERRMDEWLQGQNCRVSLFEPINEEESKCDGFNKSVEPKTLYINLDRLISAQNALLLEPGDTNMHDRHLFHLAVTVMHEAVHSMRHLIKEVEKPMPPQIRAGHDIEFLEETDPGKEGRRIRPDGWCVNRGEGGWWAENWALGAGILRDVIPGTQGLFHEGIRRIIAQRYDPAEESYFRLHPDTIRSIVHGLPGWQGLFPLRPDLPEDVQFGRFTVHGGYPGGSDPNRSRSSGQMTDKCRVPTRFRIAAKR